MLLRLDKAKGKSCRKATHVSVQRASLGQVIPILLSAGLTFSSALEPTGPRRCPSHRGGLLHVPCVFSSSRTRLIGLLSGTLSASPNRPLLGICSSPKFSRVPDGIFRKQCPLTITGMRPSPVADSLALPGWSWSPAQSQSSALAGRGGCDGPDQGQMPAGGF